MRRAFLILLAGAATAGAQTIPLVSVEFTGGNGPHTSETASVRYSSEFASMTRFGASFRLGRAGLARPVVVLEHQDAIETFYAGDTGCILVRAQCEKRFKSPSGNAVGLSMRAVARPWLTAGVGAGIGFFERRTAYVAYDLFARVLPHVGVVGDIRGFLWKSADGQSVYFAPHSIGIRIY
jgi:hypothetical protein